MHKRLSHKQTATLMTLMTLAREVSNPELREIVGFTLDGKDRLLLRDEQYVTSKKKGRSYSHELADRGWAWCRDELQSASPPPPLPRSTLAAATYLVLAGIGEFLQRRDIPLAEVFTPRVELDDEELAARIDAAYVALARSPGETVRLADLRAKLGDVPAERVSRLLERLHRDRRVQLVARSNRKLLIEEDHNAAIKIGGDPKHMIMIGAS